MHMIQLPIEYAQNDGFNIQAKLYSKPSFFVHVRREGAGESVIVASICF